MNAKERIEQLVQVLSDANYRYYVLDDPQMPDFEYDMLLRELENPVTYIQDTLPLNSPTHAGAYHIQHPAFGDHPAHSTDGSPH